MKKKKDDSMIYCPKLDISFPNWTDEVIDPEKGIHRLSFFCVCPAVLCDGLDVEGRPCPYAKK